MAKKNTAATPVIVTVKELCEEFKIDGKKCRAIIRTLGLKAPKTDEEGFGPKAKYEWVEGDAVLASIRTAIGLALLPKTEAPKAEEAPETKAEEPAKAEKPAKKEAKAKK